MCIRDSNSAVDGATYIIHAFAGLVGYQQKEDGSLELYPDLAKELPVGKERDDGKVEYVYELKDGLKWSDGSDLTAHDFVYAWNRAANPETAADYGYMFEAVSYTHLYSIADSVSYIYRELLEFSWFGCFDTDAKSGLFSFGCIDRDLLLSIQINNTRNSYLVDSIVL